MNFLAAVFAFHAEEYITFWLLDLIFKEFSMRDVYLPELPGLAKHSQIINFLIFDKLPKLYNHFVFILIIPLTFSGKLLNSSSILHHRMDFLPFCNSYSSRGYVGFYQ